MVRNTIHSRHIREFNALIGIRMMQGFLNSLFIVFGSFEAMLAEKTAFECGDGFIICVEVVGAIFVAKKWTH